VIYGLSKSSNYDDLGCIYIIIIGQSVCVTSTCDWSAEPQSSSRDCGSYTSRSMNRLQYFFKWYDSYSCKIFTDKRIVQFLCNSRASCRICFTVRIRKFFAIISSLKITPHLKCVATLPCEMSIEWVKLSQHFTHHAIGQWRRLQLECVVQQQCGHIEHFM